MGKRSSFHPQVIERFKDALQGADTAGKLLYLKALSSIAQALAEQRGEGKLAESKAKAETESINKTAQLLIPLALQANLDLAVRSAAVDGLTTLRAPGVCKALLKLASAEKNGLRDKARGGIAPTALPDACGELLKAMAGADKDLAAIAKMAFVRVRDEAESRDLLPLVSDPSADVRREIVDALGKRRGDGIAAKGVTIALKDKVPDIRVLALKAIPCTGLDGPATQLAALVGDPEESVRIANAETLSVLIDDASKKVVLEAFKNNLEGKTLEAYIRALGRRSAGAAKDLKSIGMVMDILESNPGAVASIREALVYLTSAGQGSEREAQRRQWEADKWKAWYANITKREKIRAEALATIKDIAGQKDADRSLFAGLYEGTKQAILILEKAKEMCKPDDFEDEDGLDGDLAQRTRGEGARLTPPPSPLPQGEGETEGQAHETVYLSASHTRRGAAAAVRLHDDRRQEADG
ncbi:MAG: hypothetical protein NTW87_32030, partial [Planctomycetota bacterium]|nr:hypothetical protein [Planctomycetota bacterium]